MGDLISYETFQYYQARGREELDRREAAEERIKRINALLGYETDPLYDGTEK